jgi:hypothetical protein
VTRRQWIGPWKLDRERKVWTRDYVVSTPRLSTQAWAMLAPLTRTGTNTYALKFVEHHRVAA